MIEGSTKKKKLNKTTLLKKENLSISSPNSLKLNKTIKSAHSNQSQSNISLTDKDRKKMKENIISSSRISQKSSQGVF